MPPPTPARRRQRPRGRLGALLLALLVGAVGFSAYAGLHAYRALARLGGRDGVSVRELVRPPFDGRQHIFVLLMGADEKNRLHKSDERRTDTMILASMDLAGKRLAALSLPRDTRVRIPGRSGYDKLNAAHVVGGAPLVRRTVAALVNLPVDRYLKTDISGFRAIVDLIGPVEVDVEKRMDYDDNWGNLHIHLKPGRQLLDGEKAMGYVRFRHDATGDMGRMRRQQRFLRAVARKMLAAENLPRLPQVVEEASRYVETDMSARELLAVVKLLQDVPASQIATATLPGTPHYIGRVSYFVPDEREARVLLRKLFFSTNVCPRSSVEVLNGNGLPGIAGEAARRLAAAGFYVSRTGNAESFDHERTEIRAPSGTEPDARRLIAALGVGEDAVRTVATLGSRSADTVTVILGKDYRP